MKEQTIISENGVSVIHGWDDEAQATFDFYVDNVEAVIELIEEVSESDYIYPKKIIGEDGRTVDFDELHQDLMTFLEYMKSALED